MECYRAWKVVFKYSENVYCTNICYGSKKDVINSYAKYPEILAITEATFSVIDEAERKGMPIVRL